MSKCYSINGEECWEDDPHELMDDLLEHHKEGERVEIYEGESTPFRHSSFISVDSILDDLANAAYDEIGEWQDDYLDDLANDTDKKIKLERLLVDFFNNNAEQPRCFRVTGIKKIVITVEQ